MIDYRHAAGAGMALGFVFLCFCVAFSLFGVPHSDTPANLPTNTTVINNYYCNISESIPDGVYVQDYVYNETTREVENITGAVPVVTPTLWNDTLRESVGLPADGYGNPCCPHCTPTPTPACEFPWWCR